MLNIGLGMWWAVITVTTVGYGDVVPHTVGGRIIAAALMFVGIGVLSMLMAKLESIDRRLDALEGGSESAT